MTSPLSLAEAIRCALVRDEQEQIGSLDWFTPEEREWGGVSGGGRTGVIDPGAYEDIVSSVSEAITATGLISPRWTLWSQPGGGPGTVVTGDESVAERIIRIRGRGCAEFRLIGCYCGADEAEAEEVGHLRRDSVPRGYRHYSRSWMVSDVISPAVVAPFGGGSSTLAERIAESVMYEIETLTPMVFETRFVGEVTRDEIEVRALMRAGGRVLSNTIFACAPEPTMMDMTARKVSL